MTRTSRRYFSKTKKGHIEKLHQTLGKAKSSSFREHDVTHLCVVLYLRAAHKYNMISSPLTGYGMETNGRKQFLARNMLVND